MIQVVYQVFNSFGFNKEFAPLFKAEEPDQLQLPKNIKDEFYQIKK